MHPASGLDADPLPAAPSRRDLAAIWKIAPVQWAIIALAVGAAVAAFYPGLRFMVSNWEQVEEYSYGWFIPVVSAFLLWQKGPLLRRLELRGSWHGLVLVAVGLLMGVAGHLSAIRLFSQYGFLVAVCGLSVAFIGWRGTRVIAAPLAILFFMIPLPQFVLRELSQQLQLVSSELGVALIRMFGISVFLEGNVIDLGSYKLQVVEACSGLRYLFPLLVLAILAAYFFQGRWWKRALIVVSAVPLTIVINSLRIAIIGYTVDRWGSAMAEGLLHDFEGWFMFMLCVLLLVAEMSVLARIGDRTATLRSTFGLDVPAAEPQGTPVSYRDVQTPLVASALVLGAVALVAAWVPDRPQVHPDRKPFALFPLTLPGGWSGRPDRLEGDVVATLAVDDYLLVDYARKSEPPVNLYSAWYDTQSGGTSSHSPRTCMPGGGWKIVEFAPTPVRFEVPGVAASQMPLEVNRAVIQKGEERQLVYYWFSQRGRELTDEWAVKWYILRDGIARDRSDGALVRLVTPIAPRETAEQADRRLAAFIGAAEPRLRDHIPG